MDRKSGKNYWRVRWNDVNGKECVKVFGMPEEADAHIEMITKIRKKTRKIGGGELRRNRRAGILARIRGG
jgi:hypothetical protein